MALRLPVRIALAFALLVGAVATPAAAETTAELSVKLVKMVVPQANYDMMINQMTQQMGAAMGGKAPVEKLALVIREVLTYDELVTMTAELYAAKFTVGELKDLIAFYETPTGKKASRLLPELTAESMGKVTPLMMQRMPAAMKKHGLVP